MQKSMGLESLVQRGRTPFYNDLVTLCQDSQKAVSDASAVSSADINLCLKQMGFGKRLKAIVKKYMGVDLYRVTIVESTLPNAYCSLFPTKAADDHWKLSEKTSGMMMDNINRFYSDRDGRLSPDAPKRFPYLFDFGINTALWSIRNQDQSFYYTPEEVAALILHEAGHIDHFTRIAFRAYGRLLDASDIVTYVDRGIDRDQALAIIKAVKKSPYLTKNWLTILDTTEKYFQTSNSMDDPSYHEALESLAILVTAEASDYQLWVVNGILGTAKDRVNTRLYDIDPERSADEFSSRNGAYLPLVTAVAKFNKIVGEDAKLLFNQTLWMGPSIVLGSLFKFREMFNVGAEDIQYGYDPTIRRLELIVETAKHAFHDPDLPPDVRSYLNMQILQCDQYIKDYQSAKHRQVRTKFKQWHDSVSKFGRIIASPFQNRLAGNYEKLQDATRSLSRHPLYYLGNK